MAIQKIPEGVPPHVVAATVVKIGFLDCSDDGDIPSVVLGSALPNLGPDKFVMGYQSLEGNGEAVMYLCEWFTSVLDCGRLTLVIDSFYKHGEDKIFGKLHETYRTDFSVRQAMMVFSVTKEGETTRTILPYVYAGSGTPIQYLWSQLVTKDEPSEGDKGIFSTLQRAVLEPVEIAQDMKDLIEELLPSDMDPDVRVKLLLPNIKHALQKFDVEIETFELREPEHYTATKRI